MCGISGQLVTSSLPADALRSQVCAMADAIRNRGPDDGGFWIDASAGVALAHRRLSILDLSPAGHQPMASRSGRYIIIFNGEIYNHLDLRSEIEKAGNWRAKSGWLGHSDTETLLAGFDSWGVISTVKRTIGMFAIAVWDRETQNLTLVRDRIGEKPIYYGWQGKGNNACFIFGSELKALRAHSLFCSDINRDALCLFMRHGYIPAPHTIYHNIFKLLPGCSLTVSLQKREPILEEYWSLTQVAQNGVSSPFEGDAKEAVDGLEALLKDSVRQQMMSDVPLGAFLSGGIDSSTVVALMQAQTDKPVKTFTIGFKEEGYNEAVHAKAVARHLGTEHNELYVTPDQALAVIPKLPTLYCEPFADSSQIPTFLVSQLARRHVAVSLSGDAGDELFCGYNRYKMMARIWGKLSLLPHPFRQLAAGLITAVPPGVLDKVGGLFSMSRLGDRLHKGAGLLDSYTVSSLYKGMVSHWSDPSAVVLGSREPPTVLTGAAPELPGFSDVERMMALDMLSYLPDDILVKVDRAAMGVSLETRVPMLDHRVVEFAWSLPLNYKLRYNMTKWPLRQVLYRHVPRELVERPKMGFGVPIDHWLRGPLRDWAESLLSESRLKNEGFFDPVPIRRKWKEHLSGHRNWQYHLWNVLIFQAWLEENHP